MCWASEQASGRRPRTYISALLFCLHAASAQADDAMDAWANWALAPKVWKGQTVLAPEPQPRPAGTWLRVDSIELPLRAHVPLETGELRSAQILRAFERAYTALSAFGWPIPAFDGGYGGSAAIDLYAVAPVRCRDACAEVAAPRLPSDFDAALTYAEVARDLPAAALDACVHSALAQAGLRAADPAEAESWVRASAELSVWQATGELGCDESFARAQLAPELGLLNADPSSAAAGALLLALLSERLETQPGMFVRGLWETTRQRSQGLVPADRLRGSPDLWEVLRETLAARHQTLDDVVIELNVARYFAGPAERRAQAPYRFLAALPSAAAVPIRQLHDAQLPARLLAEPALHDLGSAYVRVQLNAAARREQLQVWLHAEQGPRWSLTAVRLDAVGRERGRTSAPARDVPNSYLPIALDADTSAVLLVITQLARETPDADRAFDTSHGYELIVN